MPYLSPKSVQSAITPTVILLLIAACAQLEVLMILWLHAEDMVKIIHIRAETESLSTEDDALGN